MGQISQMGQIGQIGQIRIGYDLYDLFDLYDLLTPHITNVIFFNLAIGKTAVIMNQGIVHL